MVYQSALSPSRAKEYMQCPLKFRFSVVDKLPQPPTVATVKGTLVHAVLETLFQSEPENRTYETAISLLSTQWEDLKDSHPDYMQVFDDTNTEPGMLADSELLLSSYFQMEHPPYISPAACESRIETQLSSGLHLRGIVDRIDKAPDGRIRVIDYKTGKAPSKRFMEDALFQMRFYALMLREVETLPTRMQLLYLKTSNVLTLDPLEEDISEFEGKINSLWSRISSDAREQNFSPRKTPLCGWCQFQSLCPLFGGEPVEISESGIKKLLSMQN